MNVISPDMADAIEILRKRYRRRLPALPSLVGGVAIDEMCQARGLQCEFLTWVCTGWHCRAYGRECMESYARRGGCPSCTIIQESTTKKKWVNPLKASKRRNR